MTEQLGHMHRGFRYGIGSDFEVVDSSLTRARPLPLPWFDDDDGVYLESGRQGFAIIEAVLRARGHHQLYVPDYLCDSMIEAFVRHGWKITPLTVDDALKVDSAILSGITSGVVLHCNYFGTVETEAQLCALRAAQSSGVVVIADETHRIFSPRSVVADFRLASLRKLLPIPHGAFVVGLRDETALVSDGSSRGRSLRNRAMREKSRAILEGDPNSNYRDLFLKSEKQLSARLIPTRLDRGVVAFLGRLDLVRIRRRRIENANTLYHALDCGRGFSVLNPPSLETVSSHLVLKTEHANDLQTFLANRGVYCSVHWPPSKLLGALRWRSCYLSLPIDQRYGNAEMEFIAMLVHEYFDNRIRV